MGFPLEPSSAAGREPALPAPHARVRVDQLRSALRTSRAQPSRGPFESRGLGGLRGTQGSSPGPHEDAAVQGRFAGRSVKLRFRGILK